VYVKLLEVASMEHIITFLIRFVGDSKFVRNPYLRSQLMSILYISSLDRKVRHFCSCCGTMLL
jgi:Ubiquitin elongating factor core